MTHTPLLDNPYNITMKVTNEDLSLVSQVAGLHDKAAFNELVRKYQSPIRRFFLHQTLGDEQLSDDLAQDTFIKAYTNIHQFKGTAAFSTWLYRIAYNVLYDHHRRQRPTTDTDCPAVANRCAANSEQGMKMDVYGALARLADKERTCVTLQLVDGYPIERIAEITGMAVGTVKSHIFRGKQKLTMFLKQNGY